MNKIETPYFLIDKKELKENFLKLKNEFEKQWNNLIIGYSFKTNSLPWIIDFFKTNGAYAEVVSKDEYNLAKRMGYTIDKIIYNGPVKSKDTFLEAVEDGAIVNIDSFREIEWLKEIKSKEKIEVGIRINFDLEKACPNESSCGERGGRFGFNFENLEYLEAIKQIKELGNIDITGIHLHNSTKTRSLNIYKALAEMALKLKETIDSELKYIDIGGGFFGGLKTKPQFNEYAEVIANTLKEKFDKEITLIIEPGAALIAAPISFVTKVVSEKKVKEHKIITIDGSCNNLNPLMRDKGYFYEITNKDTQEREVVEKQIVAGYTCMENDILLNLENKEELKTGDLIIFKKVGSYTSTLSPLFIEYFPAVIVFDEENQKYFYARKRWGVEEFIQKNYIGNEKEI